MELFFRYTIFTLTFGTWSKNDFFDILSPYVIKNTNAQTHPWCMGIAC